MSNSRKHWERVYESKKPSDVSWYQPHLVVSLDMIERSGITQADHIIDVGGGASTLVDDLLDRGFHNLTVLDISSRAIDISRTRLANRSTGIQWIVGDVLLAPLGQARYRLWHDRAVLHFLTDAEAKREYTRRVRHAVRPGGFVVISTFSADGPSKCSGLEVCRYVPETLLAEFGPGFRLEESLSENHRTPSGAEQAFLYCLLSFDGTMC